MYPLSLSTVFLLGHSGLSNIRVASSVLAGTPFVTTDLFPPFLSPSLFVHLKMLCLMPPGVSNTILRPRSHRTRSTWENRQMQVEHSCEWEHVPRNTKDLLVRLRANQPTHPVYPWIQKSLHDIRSISLPVVRFSVFPKLFTPHIPALQSVLPVTAYTDTHLCLTSAQFYQLVENHNPDSCGENSHKTNNTQKCACICALFHLKPFHTKHLLRQH